MNKCKVFFIKHNYFRNATQIKENIEKNTHLNAEQQQFFWDLIDSKQYAQKVNQLSDLLKVAIDMEKINERRIEINKILLLKKVQDIDKLLLKD